MVIVEIRVLDMVRYACQCIIIYCTDTEWSVVVHQSTLSFSDFRSQISEAVSSQVRSTLT